MYSYARILKDFRDAGHLHGLINPWGFVDDHALLMKSGALALIYRLNGRDYECLDHAERARVAHRYEAACRQLDDTFRVYQYLLKRRIGEIPTRSHPDPLIHLQLAKRAAFLNGKRDGLYELRTYAVVMNEAMPRRQAWRRRLGSLTRAPFSAIRDAFSAHRAARFLADEIDRVAHQLYQRADGWRTQLDDTLAPRLLRKDEAFAFLRELLNYGEVAPSTLKYDTHVDYFAADTPVECERDHLRIGTHYAQVLTMKEPPTQTYAHVFEGLNAVPSEFTACLEWRPIPADRARREIQARRRHFFTQRASFMNFVFSETPPSARDMLIDDSAEAKMQHLGAALVEMDVHGHRFGECGYTIVLHGPERRALSTAAAQCQKLFAAHDGTLFNETYNLLNAWLATIPGNDANNLRRVPLLSTNYADLSFLFSLDTGERASPHLKGEEYLAVLESRHGTPYFWNLHVNDVGHTMILGATGAGKSMLVSVLVANAQKYAPRTIVFDVGRGYERLAQLTGGGYLPLGLDHQECTINPFSLPDTTENLHFLHAFVSVLLEGKEGHTLTEGESRELHDAIRHVYLLLPGQRRLLTLANLLPRRIGSRLYTWVEGGPYCRLFDNAADTLTLNPFQVFDFTGMERYPKLLEPLLFYVLHRANESIHSAATIQQLKLFVMDEAWRFMQHPTLRGYIAEALKTWRKHNAALVMATHSTEDLEQVALLRTVIESCPTKLFLANPSFDRDGYRRLFGLGEMETDLLANLRPRGELLLKRQGLSKVLTLNIDPDSYWLYTNTPGDNARVRAAVAEHGLEHGLALLAGAAAS